MHRRDRPYGNLDAAYATSSMVSARNTVQVKRGTELLRIAMVFSCQYRSSCTLRTTHGPRARARRKEE